MRLNYWLKIFIYSHCSDQNFESTTTEGDHRKLDAFVMNGRLGPSSEGISGGEPSLDQTFGDDQWTSGHTFEGEQEAPTERTAEGEQEPLSERTFGRDQGAPERTFEEKQGPQSERTSGVEQEPSSVRMFRDEQVPSSERTFEEKQGRPLERTSEGEQGLTLVLTPGGVRGKGKLSDYSVETVDDDSERRQINDDDEMSFCSRLFRTICVFLSLFTAVRSLNMSI